MLRFLFSLVAQAHAKELRVNHTIEVEDFVSNLVDKLFENPALPRTSLLEFDNAWPRKNLIDEFDRVAQGFYDVPVKELPKGYSHEGEEVRERNHVQDILRGIEASMAAQRAALTTRTTGEVVREAEEPAGPLQEADALEEEPQTPRAQIKSSISELSLDSCFRGSHMKMQQKQRSKVFGDFGPVQLFTSTSDDITQVLALALVGLFVGSGFALVALRCRYF